jgi:hypothetical protein
MIWWIERGWRRGGSCRPTVWRDMLDWGGRVGGSCPWIVCRDLLHWVSSVYPPLGGLLFLAGNPYDILCIYYTIISGRNKYRKIRKSRQMR